MTHAKIQSHSLANGKGFLMEKRTELSITLSANSLLIAFYGLAKMVNYRKLYSQIRLQPNLHLRSTSKAFICFMYTSEALLPVLWEML